VDVASAPPHDTVYGLASFIASSDIAHARKIAARLRTGTVNINYPAWDIHAPFGGYKQSGNGREYADFGIKDYLEVKAVVGWAG
jgi:aldehyde dehydrogenase (NAD+)